MRIDPDMPGGSDLRLKMGCAIRTVGIIYRRWWPSRKPRFGRNNVYFKLRRTGAADDFCRSLARGMTTMSKEAGAVTASSGDVPEFCGTTQNSSYPEGCRMASPSVPRRNALIGASLTRNPRAAATRLCIARGARSCMGCPALTAGASPRATSIVERGPRRRVPVEAHGTAVGDSGVSAPRHRHCKATGLTRVHYSHQTDRFLASCPPS
jgi:hypothetical protein